MRVLVTEFMDEAAVSEIAHRHDVDYDPTWVDRRDALLAALERVDALIVRNRTQVDQALLARAPSLRVIGRLGVGLDNIDVEACRARGIVVIPASGANALAVAEYVLATSMMLLRGAYAASDAVAAGAWPRTGLSAGREIAGKTLGIVGFGEIGRLTGRLARAVGMQAVGFDAQLPPTSPVWSAESTASRPLADVIATADVLTLHVPLTAQTKNLIDSTALATMKRDAVLVNTSRGGVVDEAALAAALRSGALGGAALDVFASEPLAPGSLFAGCPNVILTPHIAGLTAESNRRVSSMIAQRVIAALAQ